MEPVKLPGGYCCCSYHSKWYQKSPQKDLCALSLKMVRSKQKGRLCFGDCQLWSAEVLVGKRHLAAAEPFSGCFTRQVGEVSQVCVVGVSFSIGFTQGLKSTRFEIPETATTGVVTLQRVQIEHFAKLKSCLCTWKRRQSIASGYNQRWSSGCRWTWRSYENLGIDMKDKAESNGYSFLPGFTEVAQVVLATKEALPDTTYMVHQVFSVFYIPYSCQYPFTYYNITKYIKLSVM